MGNEFIFMSMLKDLYRRYPVKGTFVMLGLSIFMFLVILIEFDMKLMNIESTLQTFYYIIVTMTTVGFGDLSVVSFIGQWAMIMATFFGVVFEGLFLVAWANFIRMDPMENDSFLLI